MKQIQFSVGENYGSSVSFGLAGSQIPALVLKAAYAAFEADITGAEKNKSGDLVGGLTRTQGVGYWLGKPENVTVFTVYLTEAEYAYATRSFEQAVQRLKLRLYQDSIMVAAVSAEVVFA